MVKEESRAVFIGKDTVWIGWVKEEDDTVFVRVPNKAMPFMSKYRPILSNVKDHMSDYQEKVLISLNDGRGDEKVRVYPIDLDTFESNFVDINPRVKRSIESLHAERNFLYGMVKEMEGMLKTAGMHDLLKMKFKDEYGYFTSLKPGFMYNDNDKKGDKKK